MIAPMSRTEIVCLNSIRAEVVKFLHDKGLLHLEEVGLENESAPNFLNRVNLQGPEHEALMRLEGLDRTLNEIAPLLTRQPGPEVVRRAAAEAAAWPESSWDERVAVWASRLKEETRKKVAIQDTLDVLANYKHILEDVAPALGGGDVKLGKGSRALVLSGNINKAVERLEQRLREEIGENCTFHQNRVSRKKVVGLITFPESKDEAVGRILSQEGITPVDLRDEAYQNATLGEVIRRIEANLEKNRAQIAEIQAELDRYSEEVGAPVVAMRALVGDHLARMRAQLQFAESRMVTVIRGWIPSDQFGELEQALERDFAGKAAVTQIAHDDIPHNQIPTLLRNPKFFQPFEILLKLFKPPTYGTVDPTPLIAVSFIVFYGFILGDVGYGVGVILFAKWLGKKWGRIQAVRSASTIGVYMGISSIIFGVIFGEYFGNFGETMFHVPYLFHRAHETTQLLIFAILFGLIHIPLALVLGIREDFRHHHPDHALEKLGMLLALTALIFGVCVYFGAVPLGIPLFTGGMAAFFTYLSVVLFALGVVLIFRAMGVMGLVGVLHIVSLGGNVLSYARLMALGVASIALADIANMLPGMMGYALGIPMAMIVHLLNIGIGMASPTIHSLRLNFVEFLPKFYNPDGKSFSPFRKETVS